MGRLLDEDMIIKVLERWQKAFKENSHYVSASDLSLVVKDVKELPPAQPDPKEGHWIWVAGELMCSECRTIYSDLYPDYDNAVACPHCGARMKGERQK